MTGYDGGELSALKQQKLRLLYRRYPDAYATDVLGLSLTPDQTRILASVATNRRTVVASGHACGKTLCAAVAASWWYDCWPAHICYVTAPTWPAAFGLTFKQLRILRAAKRLPGEVLETGIIRDPDEELRLTHFVRALNAEKGEGFQGEHTAPVLVIMEEGVGVPGYIWRASEGLMTAPECRVLAIGNPTDEASDFGAAFASPVWTPLQMSCLNHPNILAELAGQPAPLPAAVRLQWVQEMIQAHCRRCDPSAEEAFAFPPGSGEWWQPDDEFRGRVLGEFSDLAGTHAIPLAWARACINADLRYADGARYEARGDSGAGLDLGDRSNTLVIRQGPVVRHAEQWAGSVEDAIPRAITTAERLGCRILAYDAQGPGVAVPDILPKLSTPLRVYGVNVGVSVPDDIVMADSRPAKEVYANLRAYIWHGLMRERCRRTAEVRRGAAYDATDCLQLGNWAEMVADLGRPLLKRTGTRLILESKQEMAVRGVASPHYGDALALTFAPTPLAGGRQGVRYTEESLL